ncbi:MAG: DUF5054 domain-containing protein [Butyricicoccus sp.]
MGQVKKVYVIHKTHLDIGFTGFAQDILDRYVEEFIPKAIETAYICNADGKKNFIWTVGSYLIDYYLKHADADGKARLEQAIRDGYIVWHALPCTTETEVMTGELFRYGLSIGRRLEKRFGKEPCIAAKMTDVPCHTAAMLPDLCAYGVRYLHIGINGSSRPIEVPALSVWKYGPYEVVLNYAGYYGRPCVFGEVALEFAHTSDNMGPPTPEGVRAEMERLRQVYPDAEIVSASLDDFAREVLRHKDQLPVLEMECGDTWIHNASSDPWKTGMLCELLRLEEEWRGQASDLDENADYQTFMENLLLVCEHTCGLDCKKFLYDFQNWDKADFQKARAEDVIGEPAMRPAGALIHDYILNEELPCYTNGQLLGSYRAAERSWEEQRDYIRRAVACLPPALRRKAEEAEIALSPSQPTASGAPCDGRTFEIAGYRVAIQPDGSLKLLCKDGQEMMHTVLGELRYATYSAQTVEDCYLSYNTNFEATRHWAEPDFAKPGLQYSKTAQDMEYAFAVRAARRQGNQLELDLEADQMAAETYGCPRLAQLRYTFGEEQIGIHLEWFDKDANHLPEALFFGFTFDRNEHLRLYKLERPIDPYQVVAGGNRKLHACQRIESDGFVLKGLHSPLVSIGGRHLYDVDDAYGDIRDGLHFVLVNNRWNTNCPVYYEQNAAFDFVLTI